MQQSNGQKAKNQEVPQVGRLVFSKNATVWLQDGKPELQDGKPELQNQNNYTKCPPIRRTVVPARNAPLKKGNLTCWVWRFMRKSFVAMVACCWAEKLSWTVPKLMPMPSRCSLRACCKERPYTVFTDWYNFQLSPLAGDVVTKAAPFSRIMGKPRCCHENTGNSVCLFGRSAQCVQCAV